MTDKEYNEQRTRVRKLIKKWHQTLGLNWWRLKYEFKREKSEKDSDDDKDWATTARCIASPNYLDATIIFYLPEIATMDDNELEETVLHEMMHVFLSPMSTKEKDDEEERVATTLARAFIYTYLDTVKSSKKKLPEKKRASKMPQKRLKKEKTA